MNKLWNKTDYIFYWWYLARKNKPRTVFDVWVYLLTSLEFNVDSYRKEFYERLSGIKENKVEVGTVTFEELVGLVKKIQR